MTLRLITHKNGATQQVRLAWRKQSLDGRDRRVSRSGINIPSSVDLRPYLSEVEDQGDLGSCTANMFAGMIEANEIKRRGEAVKQVYGMPDYSRLFGQKLDLSATPGYTIKTSVPVVSTQGVISFTTTLTPAVVPTPTPAPTPAPVALIDVSRLFHYYATRKIEGTTAQDSGATIRDTLKAGNKYGVLDEKKYPYNPGKFAQNPPDALWTEAAKYKVTAYHSIADGDLTTIKSVVADGYAVGFGFTVYSYFMSQEMANSAKLCVPASTEFIEGGHAVCVVGYDDKMVMPDGSVGAFLIRNSWGKGWGLAGYFWMSYKYVGNTSLCSDFWVIQASPI